MLYVSRYPRLCGLERLKPDVSQRGGQQIASRLDIRHDFESNFEILHCLQWFNRLALAQDSGAGLLFVLLFSSFVGSCLLHFGLSFVALVQSSHHFLRDVVLGVGQQNVVTRAREDVIEFLALLLLNVNFVLLLDSLGIKLDCLRFFLFLEESLNGVAHLQGQLCLFVAQLVHQSLLQFGQILLFTG